MRLLVVGAGGQLGAELIRSISPHKVIGLKRDALDVTDTGAVAESLERFRPDAVVNASAYTAVDRAESEPEAAFGVNRDGAANLATACARLAIPLVHVSTDYVFDGRKSLPYVEEDVPNPLGVYGRSKQAGEEAVREVCPRHLIFRTSWVFSAHGHNFVKTMLRLGAEREELAVVADQRGRPTAAAELARLILAILPEAEGKWGTYHLAQPEPISWHGFAEAIFAEARKQGMDLRVQHVHPITTEEYPTPAERPRNSVLDCRKIEETFGVRIQPWREALKDVIRELNNG
ncbi:MAG: dTDP-4-dehydrorhamnose reductase [Candidatus Dadabacteria bacterium]|nr:MAG: dTDP-4-dehydrorhamnose reductase [Candidatus Dadabacteria bacterium]